MHEVIGHVWPHLGHMDAPWYLVKNRFKYAWLDMQTHVLGLEINFKKNAVLEQMFNNSQDYNNHSFQLT